ncbi:unnamed protein product [Meganyctiphanes norvegica]|uniref:Uncharacterized protein n=1 Tax=Meganyctiphanes norvegica TaxID=48144 RepID=A0AAV2QC02_MEGNR
MKSGYRLLLAAIVASVVAGQPQTTGGAAPAEEVITCDCVQHLNAKVMPSVNAALNSLSSSVDQLFREAKATGISPVAVRGICFLCGRTQRVRNNIRRMRFNKRRPKHCKCRCNRNRSRCSSCCRGRRRGKRQASGSQVANLPLCPINDVLGTAQTAREGTQLVQEVTAAIRLAPEEVNQDLLDDITSLYNEVNESVINLQRATDPNSSECGEEQYVPDVLFPGEF